MICGIANNRKLSFLIKPFSSFCLVYISHVGHSVKTQATIPSEQVLLTSQRPFSLYILVIVRNDSSIYQKLYKIQNGKYFQHVWLPTSRDVKITWLREPICRRAGWRAEGHKTYLLDHIQLSPGHPPSRLHGQIGAACGKNSCLFSETDKSIQIMQCKSQPESSWKNLFLATVTDPPTPSSNDIQACFPSSLLAPTSTDWPFHHTSAPCLHCQSIQASENWRQWNWSW